MDCADAASAALASLACIRQHVAVMRNRARPRGFINGLPFMDTSLLVPCHCVALNSDAI